MTAPTPAGAPPSQPGNLYISTAIPYVNAAPHIGFALELVQTDSLARYYRATGHKVHFQTGSDENSLKNLLAAESAGLSPQAFVAANAHRFQALRHSLDLSYDDFIRTSVESRHRRGVEALWRALVARGDIYRRAYRGLYCTGCEQFYKPAELDQGLCPEHATAPQEIAEENYFFRLSRYRDALLQRIASGALAIEPAHRRNEVLSLVEGGLEDFSVSRSQSRARGWGIPVPDDPDQVVYVWLDALCNYITALGYGGSGDEAALLQRFWHGAERRLHVIGKGITRFHAVYWPAILLSAGLPLPDRVLVHGYVTVDGAKIGKSSGNSVDPLPLTETYGSDVLRYYLLRHIRSTEDGDFSQERLHQAYRSDLADKLGNLLQRCLGMVTRYCEGVVPGAGEPGPLRSAADSLPGRIDRHVEAFALHEALATIWELVQQANRHVTETAPWELAKARDGGGKKAAAAAEALDACLHDLFYALRAVAQGLAPFMPATAARILWHIGVEAPKAKAEPTAADSLGGLAVRPGAPLFPHLPSTPEMENEGKP